MDHPGRGVQSRIGNAGWIPPSGCYHVSARRRGCGWVRYGRLRLRGCCCMRYGSHGVDIWSQGNGLLAVRDFRAQDLKRPRINTQNRREQQAVAKEQQRKAPSNNCLTKAGLKMRFLLHPTILEQTSTLKLHRRLLEGEFEFEEKWSKTKNFRL